MNGSLSLNGVWDLTFTEDNPDYFAHPALRGRGMLRATVPAPVHRVLMDAGLLEDPNYGMNSLRARWVEEQFWCYRRDFEAPNVARAGRAWLQFDRLEFDAVVTLNGEVVGRHANAHRPALFEVTGKLREGSNQLIVRLESGLYSTVDRPVLEYSHDWPARITRRAWHRKPQYQCGWDWNPRMVNVGILGDVRLEWASSPVLRDVTVFAVPGADLDRAMMHVRATVVAAGDTAGPVALRAVIRETGRGASASVTPTLEGARVAMTIEIEQPALWWPEGHGEQALYHVDVTLDDACEAPQRETRRTGVRKVEMDQSRHPVTGRYCVLRINDRPIFCKGGNWVPPDMLYSEVTPERYRELVDLARQANFNTLRVWGGALFADRALCEACDEAGVLLWHDFLFACSKYPGDHPEFAAEVRREVTHAVRDLAHHPSLVVWCGNNEVEWGDWTWGYDDSLRTHPHYALFHHDIPKIVLEENPSVLHWLSSPWSPDYADPNDPTVGDQHPWEVSIMDTGGADFWKYRACVDRFPNEGGVLGASSIATLRQFLPEGERSVLSPSWQHHDNPLAAVGAPGQMGRAYETVRLWLGREPESMSIEDYAFLSGLLQAEGLQEYILNYRRRMFSSASAIFWMYNDSWPVTHGWTIVDYYRRRKLAYHPVRRAFAPLTVVVAVDDAAIGVYGVNERMEPWRGSVRYGVFGIRGGCPLDTTIEAEVPANSSRRIASLALADLEVAGSRASGAFAVLYDDGAAVAQHRLLVERFRDLDWGQPSIRVEADTGGAVLTADQFAWGVCLDVEGDRDLPDNCFDLLPGIPYRIAWPADAPLPCIVRAGSPAGFCLE